MTEAMIPAKEFEGELWIKASDHQLAITLVTAHEREKVAQWIMAQGYATGHGDTIEEMLKELDWQVREHERNEFATHALKIAKNGIEAEREFCAKVADEWVHAYEHPSKVIAETIRKRGQA